MRLSRRQIVVVALVGVALLAGVAAAAHIAGVVPINNGVTIGSDSGMNVTVTGSTDMLFEDAAWPTTDQVYIITEAGNASFNAAGPAAATVNKDEIEGTWTNLTAVSADTNTITVDPDDKSSFVVGKQIDSVSIESTLTIDDGNVDFAYSASANGRLTIQGLAANTRVAAIDRSTGNILDEDTTDNNGQITFNELSSGTHDVKIQTFSPNAPTLSNPSPTGDQSNPPTQISIDVNDADFPRTDSVTVTIDLDGSQIHSETITSNSTVTASVPASGQTGGSHSWSVEATDDYGETTTDSYSYNVPSQLQIRDETPGHDLIKNTTDPIKVEAIFYEDVEDAPTILNKTTTDGNVSLTGLPVSSEFSVAVEAPGYNNRTVRVENIFEQSDVFLAEKTQPTLETRFVVADRTGNFPPEETEIRIEAAVNETLYNGSGGFQWMSVAGDDLGADEAFTTDLIDEKRYRIVVANDDGDQRILGAYTAEGVGTVNLNIGSVVIDPEADDSVGFNATYTNTTGQQPTVTFQYNDSTQNTDTLYLHIYEYNNESNELLANTSYSGPFGTFSQTETVPKGENGTTWTVDVTAVRSGGDDITFERIVGPNAPVLGNMAPWLVSVIFVGLIWTTAGLFSQLNGDIGAVVVAGLGAILFFIDMVPGYLGAGVVALSLIAAALLFIRERNAGGL